MTLTMSYQYPPPPPGTADMDMPPTGYLPSYNMATSQSNQDPDGNSMTFGDVKESDLTLRRSFSTPSTLPFQQTGVDAAALGASAEKKRSKLGYHRTSVACGHCRRRKIRCVPSATDAQGRCCNCIRLKKDCSFYPVEQQKGQSRSSDGQQDASASSSPAMPESHPSEGSVHHQSFSPVSMNSGPGLVHNPTPSTVSSNGTVNSRGYPYGSQGMMGWMPADLSPAATSKASPFENYHSRPEDSPIASQFPPYGHPVPQPGTWIPDTSQGGPRPDYSWNGVPTPLRSMSYSGEGMPGHPHSQYPPATQSGLYERRLSNFPQPYPSTVEMPITPIESVHEGMSDPTRPLSSAAAPNQHMWQQPPDGSQIAWQAGASEEQQRRQTEHHEHIAPYYH